MLRRDLSQGFTQPALPTGPGDHELVADEPEGLPRGRQHVQALPHPGHDHVPGGFLGPGAEHIRRYEPAAPFKHVRAFCQACGSPLGEPSETHEVFPVAASALDDDPGVRPVLHQNVAAKPDWLALPDDGVKRMDGTYGG